MQREIRCLALALALLTAPVPAAAQSCDEQAASRGGGWIRGDDAGGKGSPVTSRHRAQITPILDTLAELVRRAYPEPVGSQGKVYRNYGLEPFAGDGLATYELVANVKGYSCDRSRDPAGVVSLQSETGSWLYLQVNSFWSGSSKFETPQYFLSSEDHQGIYALAPARVLRTPSPADRDRRRIDASLPAGLAAYPSFIQEGQYDSTPYSYNRREVSVVVFLTPDRRPPYEPVTVGEFLDLNERRLAAYVRENEQWGGMESYRELLERIPGLRQRFASRLDEPAHIRGASWSESELANPQPFADAESGHLVARRAVRWADGNDPYQPRFITVFWRYQPEYAYSVALHEAIKSGLDFAALDALLAR